MSEGLRGKVKWFNNAKGFGFIENNEGDVFVHYSVIESDGFKSLKDGDEVTYEIQRGSKGLQATRVAKVKTDKTSLEDDVAASVTGSVAGATRVSAGATGVATASESAASPSSTATAVIAAPEKIG